MNLSAPDISLLVVVLLSALALAAMWLGDRSRTYMLWWAMAHAALPVVTLLAMQLDREMPPHHPLNLQLSLAMSVQSVCLIAGVVSYHSPQLRPLLRPLFMGGLVLLLSLLTYLTALQFDIVIARRAAALVTVAALLASAVLLWSLGRFERVAALFFAMRGLLALVLPLVMGWTPQGPFQMRYTPSFTVLLAIGTMLALLIAAYQRSLDQLRQQYLFLELAQELTARLQGVTNETDLAQQVLGVLEERLKWHQGVVMGMTPEPLIFTAVATFGLAPGLLLKPRIQVSDTGLINTALQTKRVCHSAELRRDLIGETQFGSQVPFGDTFSQVVIPITHDGVVLGLIVLRDAGRRELQSAEILTIESLGQVIGLSLANARNLRELGHRANHDTLTGLGNRAALHDELNNGARDHPQRRGVVMLFDLDHFKQVNDALGHAVGDQLLQALAERLQQHLAGRPAKLFRLGGDEFVILHRLEADDPLALAREMADLIAQPIQIGELSLRTPASIGVAIGPDQARDSHELLRCADVAMYHAKQHGTGVTLYERAIDAHKLEHLTLLSAVNAGLENDEFELFYQPFVNLRSGAIDGCEGLIRWRHPTLGLIGAAEFMPLIEATDLIRAVTRRVIDIAMRDTARWQQSGIDARVAINLSARNLLDPELPDYLLDSAARHRVEPRRIQLEITETILIKDPASAEAVMHRLANAGFTLALDDFGTGYSSLAYLARFPLRTLKIDRSFVRDMLAHAQSRTIVESTIALARGLGLQVTAEGVEQLSESKLLRQLGCDYVQGFLFSRPIPEAQMSALWRQRIAEPAVNQPDSL